MEKRGDIVPGITPPEAAACRSRVEEMKQRFFPFIGKMATADAKVLQVNELDSDFRKVAAEKTTAALQ